MLDNYEHYISKNIKLFYRKKLVAPIIFIILLAILWIIFPLFQMLRPYSVKATDSFHDVYERGKSYCSVTLKDLRFTGYTKQFHSSTSGYYYYCTYNDECIIVLLNPRDCEEGLPLIESLHVNGKLDKGGDTLTTVYSKLSEDLGWTAAGILQELPEYYLNQPNYNSGMTVLLFVAYFAALIYAVVSIVLFMIYIRFPHLSPSISNLIVFGNPKKLLEHAEEELATLPQLATEDMFITEHYFIMSSANGNVIVPIDEILWIYKYSTLHKVLWYHFSISYTLHISANKHLYVHSPKNSKSDIDGIIDYLSEANHNILVGFNEKNRLAVQEIQGKPLHIEKLYALFGKK